MASLGSQGPFKYIEYGVQGLGFTVWGFGLRVPLKYIEYGVYGDLSITYPKPCPIYLRGTIYLLCSATTATSLLNAKNSSHLLMLTFPCVQALVD